MNAPLTALLADPSVCAEFKRAVASSPAMDRAEAAIALWGCTVLPRRRILQLKAGARIIIHEPWRLDRVNGGSPIMGRLQAALAMRWFRRFGEDE